MRRWGVIVSIFYALVVLGLLLPGIYALARMSVRGAYAEAYAGGHGPWAFYAWAALLIGGEALLLFLSVDGSWRPRRPRCHLLASVALVAMAAALLVFAAGWSIAVGVLGDREVPGLPASNLGLIAWWLGLWAAWGVAFLAYYRASPLPLARAVAWLLRGSVLELLVAVPAHVIVRRREDCSAPMATGFGIATGIAIMLMCFGPGVLALYRKRLAAYRRGRPGAGTGP